MRKLNTKIILIINFLVILPILADIEPRLDYEFINGTNEEYSYVKLKPLGFPTGLPLTLTVRNLSGKSHSWKVKVNSKLSLIDVNTGEELFPTIGKCARGEPLHFTLTDNDKIKASVPVVSNPIQVTDKSGHLLTLSIISRDAKHYVYKASGFGPNEELTFFSKSENEKIRHPIKASPQGTVEGILSPSVIGIPSGKGFLEIIGTTTDSLKVKYIWGKEAFNQ